MQALRHGPRERAIGRALRPREDSCWSKSLGSTLTGARGHLIEVMTDVWIGNPFFCWKTRASAAPVSRDTAAASRRERRIAGRTTTVNGRPVRHSPSATTSPSDNEDAGDGFRYPTADGCRFRQITAMDKIKTLGPTRLAANRGSYSLEASCFRTRTHRVETWTFNSVTGAKGPATTC